MRALIASVALVIALVSIQPCASAQTSRGPTQPFVPARHFEHLPSFSYLRPVATTPAQQRLLDKYLASIVSAIGYSLIHSVFAFGTSPAPAANGSSCRPFSATVFVEPHVHWTQNADAVSGDASIIVTDCVGAIFYDGRKAASASRDASTPIGMQVDTVVAAARDDLIREFTEFVSNRQDQWTTMLASGRLTSGFKTAEVMAAIDFTNCATNFNSGHYSDALILCSSAEADGVAAIDRLQDRLSDPGRQADDPTFIERAFITVEIKQIIAESRAQLGDIVEGRAKALETKRLMLQLRAYIARVDPAPGGGFGPSALRQMDLFDRLLEQLYPGILAR